MFVIEFRVTFSDLQCTYYDPLVSRMSQRTTVRECERGCGHSSFVVFSFDERLRPLQEDDGDCRGWTVRRAQPVQVGVRGVQRGAAARVPHGLPYASDRRLAAVLLDAVRNLEGERRRRRFRRAWRQAAHVPEGDAARSRVCRGHRVLDGRASRARRLSEVGPRDRLPLGRVDALGGGPGRTPGLLDVHARQRVRVG